MNKGVLLTREKLKDRTDVIFLSITFCFLWTIYGPLELLYGNQTDLSYNMYTLCGYMLPVFMVMTLCLTTVLLLLKRKSYTVFQFCTAIILSIATSAYIQGTFLSDRLPPLDGRTIEWASYVKEALISTAVWIAVPAVVFVGLHCLSPSRRRKLVTAFSAVMVFMLVIAIVLTCISTEGYHRHNGILQSDTYLFEMSQDENLIILLLDAVDGARFQRVMEKHPEYEENLEDFTFFDNVMSGYPNTARSVPFMLSGLWYENEQGYREYCTEAFTQSPLFEKLKNEGYRMGFYDPDFSFVLELEDIFENISKAPFFASPCKFVALQLKLTAYQYFPFVLKKFCTVSPSEIERATLRSNGIEGSYSWENDYFLKKLEMKEITLSDEKCFRYIYLCGAHTPFLYPAKCPDFCDYSYESSIEMCMTIVNRYLQKLKENNVYDNTVIVILSDHGYTDGDEPEGRQNPFLLIKGKQEKHAFAVNSAPVSHEDLQEAYARLIDGAESSKAFKWDEDSERNRRYFFMVYQNNTMTEYFQTGRADCEETLLPSGRVYAPWEN